MATTILITGTTGLVGFRVLLAALEAGHNVRYTVRSEEGAQRVSSNPAVRKLAPSGSRLSAVVAPDLTAPGAFDAALQGVTHVIHAGSPVPIQTFDPMTQVFEPTVKMASSLLSSALRTPGVQRVVITSSIVGNLGLVTPAAAVSASTRVPLPDPFPSAIDDLTQAYVLGKMVELHNTDEFVKTQNPHFTVSHVIPGWVYGRNELALDATMMRTQNSSNNFLMLGMVGGELPFPIQGGFVHVDDLADLHLRVAFLESELGVVTDFGAAAPVDLGTIFDHVEKAFPKAVAAGILSRGKVPTLPLQYSSSDVETLIGRGLKSFETAVVDVAGQYLETLGIEKT